MKRILLIIFSAMLVFSCTSKQGRRAQEGPRGERPSASQLISEMDGNKDGKLSKSEARGPLADNFANIDSNKDGFLTSKELNREDKQQGNRPPRQENTTKNLSAEINRAVKVLPVNKAYFIKENIIGDIQEKTLELSGVETLCYVIKTNSQATEHQMGPWCPRHIDDGIEKAGIWFKDGKVYDVSGHFIAKLDEFYSDEKWKLYKQDGSINVTDTKDGCLAAAKPNVEQDYHNYCVECLPEYFKDQTTTYVIPATPIFTNSIQTLGRGGLGIALNGVRFDPPAPLHAILAAHTIAPLDDHGGHVNPHGGYHYHAATGSTKEIDETDEHSSLIGYAIDGFGIYGFQDSRGNEAKDLDECGGHSDDRRGYHYHAGEPGRNQIIECLHGIPGYTEVKE